jgi:hypothetical protein
MATRATAYMDEMGKMTKGEIAICCAALNTATASDQGGPFASPENLRFFSLAAVRAALLEAVSTGSLTKAARRLVDRLVVEIDTLLDDPEVQ